MTDGSVTGRDRVWGIALRVATRFAGRGYLEEFSPETVAEVAAAVDVDVSTRTIRRVLGAMTETGVLEDVGDGERVYRLATDMSLGRRHLDGVDRYVNEEELDPVSRSVRDARSPRSPLEQDTPLILHLFADWGVEAEALAAYGRVIRIGLDPADHAFSDPVQADDLEPPVRDDFDLVVAHPPCQRWSTLTPDPDDHPNLIPETREIARELGDEYIIENVPQAPLVDPVTLSGQHFGLPGSPFRRAFETSYPVEQPPLRADLRDHAGPFADEDGVLGNWRGSKRLWRTIKHVSGDYPAEAIKNNGIPAPYIHYLAYWWLRSRPDLIETPWSADLRSSSRGQAELVGGGSR